MHVLVHAMWAIHGWATSSHIETALGSTFGKALSSFTLLQYDLQVQITRLLYLGFPSDIMA